MKHRYRRIAGGGLVFTSNNLKSIGQLGALGALVAVIGFTRVVTATMVVWWPAEGRFVHNSGVIVTHYVEGDKATSLTEIHRDLALWLGAQAESNRIMLKKRLRVFSWGILAMLIEVIGLILALGDAAYA